MAKRNASASAFGWDFQVNAAIVLMLENIADAEFVRVEGETEDIEITLSNGQKIYSQAKSVEKSSSDFKNVKGKMQDAIESLSEAYTNGDAKELIYVTNSPNPFNDKKTMNIFYGSATRSYESLPDTCQKTIKTMINKISSEIDFDTNLFTIRVIPFETVNLDERYKEIKRKVDDFVYGIASNFPGMGKQVLDIWQKDLFQNATVTDTSRLISKKDLIWSIIVIASDIEKNESEYLEEIDECDYNELVHTYKTLINSSIERFEFATKVITDYNNFSFAGLLREKLGFFIDSSWTEYEDEFDSIDIEGDIKEQLIKIILYNILKQKRMISNVKKKVNL